MTDRRVGLSLLHGQSRLQTFLCVVFLIASAALLGMAAGCSGGSSSKTTTTTAPANLTYPQATVAATAGQAITVDTPTVTGAVTSYSVNPALPVGLSLNATTGAISGTPTAVAAQTTYTITATNSAGTTTTTVQITVAPAVVPPSGLTYPQATIAAMVGQAITADTPTVTGAVTSYSVSPALPAGLSLNATTGAISGTPTAVVAQTTYTITATNSAGTTTATAQITVSASVAPPTILIYPQPTISTAVGLTISPDIPTVTGTVTSYSVSPALPAGISLNSVTGAISGSATATSPVTAYTITAVNAGGSTTATVTITVSKAVSALLDVGHANQISTLRVSATRVLSQDTGNHWALWDYASGTEIASGDQTTSNPAVPGSFTPSFWPVDMAGQIIVIGQTNGLDIRATSDGHLVSEVQSPQVDSAMGNTWWKLSTDGSYICNGSKSGLTAWSSTGQQLFNLPGDYSAAKAFAAPGQVLIALGPAGQNVIQTISVADGTASTGPAFSGNFNSWFVDGQRFFTNLGTTVWTYSAASVEQSILSLPTVENLTGQGNWFWTYAASTPGYPLSIYPVGSSTASETYNLDTDTVAVASGNTIGVLPYGTPSASVIDLSGGTPVKTDYALPVAYDQAYAATSTAQWILGNRHGVVLDGTSVSTTPRFFGTGAAWSIAGGTNYAAVATAIGKVFYYLLSSNSATPAGVIDFSSSKLEMSTDDTVLVAQANAEDAQYETDRTLRVYSIPSGSLTYSFTYQFLAGTPNLFDFSLSGSGTVTGQVLGTQSTSTSPWTYTRQAGPTTGGSPIWSDSPPDSNDAIHLSPDGSLIAVSSGPATTTSVTNIYKNGLLVTAVPGFAVGWIDDNQLLVNNYAVSYPNPSVFSGCSIYDAMGALQPGCTLPELFQIQPVSSSSVFSPSLNEILSVPAGTPLYGSTLPLTGAAAVAGRNVVFVSGSRVVVDTY